jgi:ADP-ribosylglycohydrolase
MIAQKPLTSTEPRALQARLGGELLGTVVGDALGLPAEGLPPERIQRLTVILASTFP